MSVVPCRAKRGLCAVCRKQCRVPDGDSRARSMRAVSSVADKSAALYNRRRRRRRRRGHEWTRLPCPQPARLPSGRLVVNLVAAAPVVLLSLQCHACCRCRCRPEVCGPVPCCLPCLPAPHARCECMAVAGPVVRVERCALPLQRTHAHKHTSTRAQGSPPFLVRRGPYTIILLSRDLWCVVQHSLYMILNSREELTPYTTETSARAWRVSVRRACPPLTHALLLTDRTVYLRYRVCTLCAHTRTWIHLIGSDRGGRVYVYSAAGHAKRRQRTEYTTLHILCGHHHGAMSARACSSVRARTHAMARARAQAGRSCLPVVCACPRPRDRQLSRKKRSILAKLKCEQRGGPWWRAGMATGLSSVAARHLWH